MRARRWIFRLGAVSLGILLPLALLEGYLRLTGAGGGFYEPDPILGARLIPNSTGRWRKVCFDVPIRISSQGLRDVEHPVEKPLGTRRVAVLGDSLVEALQVPLEQTFPRRLEGILNASGMAPKAEVINFGVSGYGTDQMYLSLKTRAAGYRPDVVVLVFTIGNDVRNNSPALERQLSSYPKPFFRLDAGGHLVPIPFEVGVPSAAGVVGRIKGALRHLRLYDLLVGWVRARPAALSLLGRVGLVHGAPARPSPNGQAVAPANLPDGGSLDFEVYRRELPAEWVEAWRVSEALIRAVRDEAARRTARFVLVSIPSALELANPQAVVKEFPGYAPEEFDLAAPRRRLRQFAEIAGIDYVSMFDVFAEDLRARNGALEDIFLWCDGHFTPRAHQLVARAIADRLRGRGSTRARPDEEHRKR